MAHAATISSLVDGLIYSISGWTPEKDGRRFKQCKDSAVKSLRSQLHPRVNQFDIQSRLEGLEEKFIVLHKEPLADALQTRRQELAQRSSKWTPDILSLLLTLSDRPAEKTILSNIENKDEAPEEDSQLTWAEIIAEDPLTEEGIWDDIVVESDYSDDDFGSLGSIVSDQEHTTSTQPSSLGEEDVSVFAASFVEPKDDTAFNRLEATYKRLQKPMMENRTPSLIEVTELQAIRESLLVLRGLPTRLFLAQSPSKIHPQPFFCTSVCNPSTFGEVMQEFAILASQLGCLRGWTDSSLKGALLQRLKAAVDLGLSTFERNVAQIEQQFLSPYTHVVVSMLEVLSTTQRLSKSLLCLASAIFRARYEGGPWAVLDSLFAKACDLQMGAEADDFAYVATVFFECLEVYLKPIHLWMTQGKLQDDDDATFFVNVTDCELDKDSLWTSRFVISKNADGSIDAPAFIQKAANQIFISGKSTMFLDALKIEKSSQAVSQVPMKSLDIASIMESLDDSLLPFSGVFEVELRKWIDSLQSHSMKTLRNVMFSQCGLEGAMNALEDLFLAKDGARFQHFADELFARMDRNRPWSDRFILTDLAQRTLGSCKSLSAERLAVRLAPRTSNKVRRTSPIEAIDRIVVDYNISWPLRNVLRNFTICQRAFIASFRIYRAEYLLKKQQWTFALVRDHSIQNIDQALALRQRLIWFTATFRNYFADTTSTTMRNLRHELSNATDMDGMGLAYDDFQQNLEARLLLRKNLLPIYDSFLSILSICEDFAVLWTELVEAGDKHANKVLPKRKAQKAGSADAVSDESDEDDEMAEPVVLRRASQDLASLTRDYDRQLHFAIAGLRGVSRVGGEASWISLAERLQIGAEHMNKG